MKLVIISGLSGSGKSVALHTLEDEGYYCVDNLPLGLLPNFIEQLSSKQMRVYNEVAVGIDARSGLEELLRFNEILADIRAKNIDVEVIYFQADINTLIKRYNDTRRRHPLAKRGMPLAEAIELEQNLISPIALTADLCLDTTRTNIHQLRSLLKERVLLKPAHEMSLLIQSFGFKNGSPSVGLIAQEVEKVYPELVRVDPITNMKSVEYGNLVAPLIEAVKEQEAKIDAQQRAIDELRSELEALKASNKDIAK